MFVKNLDSVSDALKGFSNYEFYHNPLYLQLEAERISGSPLYWLDSLSPSFVLPLISRQVQLRNGANGADLISPYGYPGYLSSSSDSIFCRRCLSQFHSEAISNNYISSFLRLHPFSSATYLGENAYFRHVQHGKIVYVDLSSSYDTIRSNYSSAHRRAIKKSSSQRLHPQWGDTSCLGEFHRIYTQTMQRLGASEDYFFSIDYLKGLCEINDFKILSICDDSGNIACSGLFAFSHKYIQYHLAGTDERYLHLAPSKLMFDQILREFAGSNKCFIMGGGLGSIDDGLLRFKSGFSRSSVSFFSLRLVHLPELYLTACEHGQVTNRDLLSNPGPFPLYRFSG